MSADQAKVHWVYQKQNKYGRIYDM